MKPFRKRKLTTDQIRLIYEDYVNSSAVLALHYDVHPSLIRQIWGQFAHADKTWDLPRRIPGTPGMRKENQLERQV